MDDAALVRVAGKLSHQLNNILAVIKGNVTFLRETGGYRSDMDEVMTDIESATDAAIELTDRLQRFAGHAMARPERLDLRGLVEKLVARLEREYSTVAFQAVLSSHPCVVELDVGQAQDAILELSRNAAAAHSSTVWIKLSRRPDERIGDEGWQGIVRLEIHDDGQGMSADILERAKEPLFTTRGGNKAAGWGLSGVAGFVRQSGGAMGISSMPGKGTRIFIDLPEA